MNGPTVLLILFLLAAIVAVASGISIGSPLLIAAGIVVAAIGAWLAYRNRAAP